MRSFSCRWLFVLALVFLAVACAPDGSDTGSAAVTLQFRIPDGPSGLRGVLDGLATDIRVTASHGGDQLVSQTFAYSLGEGYLENIPAGPDRVFLAEALSGADTVYQGTQTGVEVLRGETVTVQVTMEPAYTQDIYAPARVIDLTGQQSGDDVSLGWTATGDDAFVGTAGSYDLRWSASTIQDSNFASATAITGVPAPAASGSAEQFTLPGTTLPGDGTYHFALRVVDDDGNSSGVSNEAVVTFTTGADTTAPGDVADLAVDGTTETSVSLTWTAPGDDGATGTVTAYDIRHSPSPIDDTNFDAATQATGPGAPVAGGQTETLTVSGLTTGTETYFALKAVDERGNWSGISNVVSATPEDSTPPAGVTNLREDANTATSVTLVWTAPGDDDDIGTADRYDIRYSQGVIDAANFDTATQWGTPPVPQAAGSDETVTIDGLDTGVEYTFALITYDDANNPSPLSNVARATPGSTDTTAPDAVTDLAAVAFDEDSVQLNWTAPGDDADQGVAAAYDIRYSENPIPDEAAFTAATPLAGAPAPQTAGTAEVVDVDGLTTGTTYYFALKARDEVDNWSGLSNQASAAPGDVTAPEDILTLTVTGFDDTSITLTWTAPGDDVDSGTATAYDIRTSESPIDLANWATATVFAGPPVPAVAGTLETVTIDSLTPGLHYYVRIRTTDDAGNESGLSNEVDQILTCTVCPVIVRIRPAEGPVGGLVYLEGTSFGATEGTLTFGAAAATNIAWSDSLIITTAPAGISGQVDVALTNLAGYTDQVPFGVRPAVDALTPDTLDIPPGGAVSLTGSGFGATQGASTLEFAGAGTGVSISAWADTAIGVDLATDAAVDTGPVVVTVDGRASTTPLFTVGTGRTWGTSANLDLNATASVTPTIASNPAGDIQVVWVETDGTDLEILGRARVGGWVGGANVSNTAEDSTLPALVSDSAGDFHLAWLEGGATPSILYSSGVDDSWTPAEVVATETTAARPALGVLSDGTVIVAWTIADAVRFNFRLPAGSWGTPADVAAGLTGVDAVAGAVDTAGYFHVVFVNGTDLVHRLFMGVWANGPAMATLTAAADVEVSLAPDSIGRLHALWWDSGSFYHSRWDVTAWTAAAPVGGLAATQPQTLQLTVDAGETLHAVVEDDTGGSYDVFHTYLAPSAGSWSAPVNLSATAMIDSRHPGVAVLPNLTIQTVWAEADRIPLKAWD